ncbi:MAG: ABC transporter permease [Planctomycetes bacterium]|nr:ABC transporter permease [Planctomycetota bacterium]
MRQFTAMMLDAYRELNARKLFWVSLAISGMVVIGFGSIGFTDKGMTIAYGIWEIEGPFTTNSPLTRPFYMGVFSYFIVNIWMTWAATILALVSTTSIYPDFLAGGAIDIVLSKPISRLKLFVCKYIASLLFVILQVTIFSAGIFLCVGLRLGEWNPKIFLAIPIITIFFSYLFSFNVLTGIVTRSSLTALLLTILFWFGIAGLATTEEILHTIKVEQGISARESEKKIENTTAKLDALSDAESETKIARRKRYEKEISLAETKRDESLKLEITLNKWHRPIQYGMWFLPKTSETVGLLSRALKDPSGLDILAIMEGVGQGDGRSRDRQNADRMVREVIEGYSLWYVLGTSLLFEFIILALAAWIFCRRDF